ncbi:MAG: hypothetical protein V4637_02765, partial [Pseudomonadota bacterium]
MKRQLVATLAAAILLLSAEPARSAAAFKIVTANERGTYHVIGKDLAKFVAPAARIDLDVVPTAGSAANVSLLRYEPGVKFAIVQADVYYFGGLIRCMKVARMAAAMGKVHTPHISGGLGYLYMIHFVS